MSDDSTRHIEEESTYPEVKLPVFQSDIPAPAIKTHSLRQTTHFLVIIVKTGQIRVFQSDECQDLRQAITAYPAAFPVMQYAIYANCDGRQVRVCGLIDR